jgi:hypothetical protein
MCTVFQYHFKTSLLFSINCTIYRWYHSMLVVTYLMTTQIEIEWKSQIGGLVVLT